MVRVIDLSRLAGADDSHPLDDKSRFHGVIAFPPIPIDQQSLVALKALSPKVIETICAALEERL